AGDTGPDRTKDTAHAGSAAWVWDRDARAAGVGRFAEAESGDFVSGATAAGTARLDHVEVGSFGKQSQSEVLFVEQGRTEATGSRNRELGTHGGGHRPSAERRGGLR